jgi:hypothetical protein
MAKLQPRGPLAEVQTAAPETDAMLVPKKVFDEMRKFVLDGGTGNLQIHFKEGRILGCRTENVIQL